MATRKTTLMLDDALIAEYKIRAARNGTSLSNVVAEAMRAYNPSAPAKPRPERWQFKVLGSGESLPNWNSNAEMWEQLDGDLPPLKQR